MPALEKIIVSDFRNIRLCELEFSKGLNCICGDNGQGKTNLLDAIHCLSMTKSAFAPSDRFCIRHGSEGYSVAGSCLMQDGMHSRFVLSFSENGGKVLRRDDKSVPKISSHIGVLPLVMVSPQDSDLVSDSGEQRRRFVNCVLSQLDPLYLSELQRYNRILAQRNHILKETSPDRALLEALDIQMTSPADYIARKRREFALAVQPSVTGHYNSLSGCAETVGVCYQSELYPQGMETPITMEWLNKSSIDRDLALRYTSSGIQRDDFIFTMDGYPIRRCGSQGQQKSFLVALKLAQYDIMKERFGFPPSLLLDDVFDKLDVVRTANLLKIVAGESYGQIFLTDTSRERLEDIVRNISSDAAFFTAKGGEIFRESGIVLEGRDNG